MADTPLHPTTLIARNKWSDDRKTIWGDSFNWSWVRPWSQLQGILIHHSVTKHDATADDIALLHKARGWAGIGYHFVITKDGVVHYVGDISLARAHVANKNEKFLGICMVGDFTKHLPSDEQILSAHDLVKFFLTDTPSIPSLNNWNQLGGHKDQQATACPGTSWGGGDMRERIVNRLPYSPVTPEPPTPPVDELYRVTQKGVQLGAFAKNPIEELETEKDFSRRLLTNFMLLSKLLKLPENSNPDVIYAAVKTLVDQPKTPDDQNSIPIEGVPAELMVNDEKWVLNGLVLADGKLQGNYKRS